VTETVVASETTRLRMKERENRNTLTSEHGQSLRAWTLPRHALEFPRHLFWKGRSNETPGNGTKVESHRNNGRQPQCSQLKTDLEF
jgi:hypothetical protein